MKNNYQNRQLIARVMDLAKAWLGNNDSAEVCYKDACQLMSPLWGKERADDNINYAGQRALESLRYSVGMDHPDYKLAVAILTESKAEEKPMKYRQDIFYKKAEGSPHQKVTKKELRELVGFTLADWALANAKERIKTKNITPEVEAFFRGDLTSCVIVHDMTSRGDIFVQLTARA